MKVLQQSSGLNRLNEMEATTQKKVKLKLGGIDGNVFSIIGAFRRQAKKEGWSEAEIDAVTNEAMSGDYHKAVATIMDHCQNGGF